MKLFFDPDLASSYREVTARLESVASNDRALRRLAVTVSDRYAAALMAKGERAGAWQAFIGSLDAFLTLAGGSGRERARLQSIVDENQDLLESVSEPSSGHFALSS